jgi:hypothetical protein
MTRVRVGDVVPIIPILWEIGKRPFPSFKFLFPSICAAKNTPYGFMQYLLINQYLTLLFGTLVQRQLAPRRP